MISMIMNVMLIIMKHACWSLINDGDDMEHLDSRHDENDEDYTIIMNYFDWIIDDEWR